MGPGLRAIHWDSGARGPRPGPALGRLPAHLPSPSPCPRPGLAPGGGENNGNRLATGLPLTFRRKRKQTRIAIVLVFAAPLAAAAFSLPRGPSGGALLAGPPLPHFLGPLPFFIVSLPSPNFKVARSKGASQTRRPPERRTGTHTHCSARAAFVLAAPPPRGGGGLRTPARRTAQAQAAGPNPDPDPRTPPWARTRTSIWDSGPWTPTQNPGRGPHPGPTTTDPEAQIPKPSPEARTRGPGAAPQRRTPDLRRRIADLRPPLARPPPAGCPPPPPPTPPGRGRKTRPGGGWGRGGPGGRPGGRMWGRRDPGHGPGRDLGLGTWGPGRPAHLGARPA